MFVARSAELCSRLQDEDRPVLVQKLRVHAAAGFEGAHKGSGLVNLDQGLSEL